MPLEGTEDLLAKAMESGSAGAEGNKSIAWEKVAAAIIDHLIKNAIITGTSPPGGGPLASGRIT